MDLPLSSLDVRRLAVFLLSLSFRSSFFPNLPVVFLVPLFCVYETRNFVLTFPFAFGCSVAGLQECALPSLYHFNIPLPPRRFYPVFPSTSVSSSPSLPPSFPPPYSSNKSPINVPTIPLAFSFTSSLAVTRYYPTIPPSLLPSPRPHPPIRREGGREGRALFLEQIPHQRPQDPLSILLHILTRRHMLAQCPFHLSVPRFPPSKPILFQHGLLE